MCATVHGCGHQRQFKGVNSLLSLCGNLGLISGHQAWPRAPLPAELSQPEPLLASSRPTGDVSCSVIHRSCGPQGKGGVGLHAQGD